MNNLYNKWFKGSLMGLALVAGMSSCSDDHFDVNAGVAGIDGTNSSASIWKNISSVESLSDFASILSKTKVTRSETNTNSSITYKDLLDMDQNFTVWAPTNGSSGFNAQEWLDLLAQGDTLAVEKRFVRNHLARFNYPNSYGETKRITMLNSKVNDYDISKMTFKDINILKDSVVPSKNGTLYLVDGLVPYSSNIYEYLDENSKLADMSNYVHTQDTAIFLPSSSTPGATVNGQIQYVDSVWLSYNKMLGSNISNEDSLYIGVYPANQAWTQAKELVGSFFKYPKTKVYYDDNSKVVSQKQNADSLNELATHSVIFQAMYFSLNTQKNLGFNPKDATLDKVVNFVNTADSIMTRGNLTIKDPSVIFKDATPVALSNGYAFVVDNYNYIPNKTWQDSITVEYENTYFYLDKKLALNLPISTTSSTGFDITTRSVTELNKNPKVTGEVSGSGYAIYKSASGSNNPRVSFKLPYVCSGTYDIYATIIPMNITDSTVTTKPTRFTASVSCFNDDGKRVMYFCKDNTKLGETSSVTLNAEDSPTSNSSLTNVFPAGSCSYITPDKDQICRVKLFENFKFPFATNGFTTEEISTVLTLQTNLSTRTERNNYNIDFYLDCIELVGKDDASSK